jgi:hypothetical protein
MRCPNPIKILFLIFMVCPWGLLAQNVENVMEAPPATSNGGINMSHIFNYTPDSVRKPELYSYYLSGNLNTTLWGVVNLPVSFAYTNNQTTANLPQPFNRFSLSPSYKWVTAHIGYTSMEFSPYTLSGHEFFGGGIELAPENGLRVAALYGRFNKATRPDSLNTEPFYQRMGGGLMLGYEHEKIDVSANIFKAEDDAESLIFAEEEISNYIKPSDNLAGSMMIRVKLPKGLAITGEYGISAINHDISATDSTDNNNFVFEKDGDVSVYHAYKTSVSQASDLGSIGATYERVAPNYKTFGAYYFTNDFENITANVATTLFSKVNISMDAGFQSDNLENQKTNTSKRAIYSANVSSPITNKLSLGASFSNVESYVHIRDIYDEVTRSNEYQNLDTLSYTQLNMSTSINGNYILKTSESQRQNLNMAFSYQEASEQQQDDLRYIGNRIYNSTLSYLFSLTQLRFNLSATINHNYNDMPDNSLQLMSYNLSAQKVFAEKFRTSFTGTYSNSFNKDQTLSNIVNLRLTGGYNLKKRHNFNLSLAIVNNNAQRGHSTHYSANFSYSYMFNFSLKRAEKRLLFEGGF